MLVDDDPLVRAGLGLILGGAPDVTVVAEATDGDEVPALVDEHHPDIVLMDIRMARVDGLTATEELTRQQDAPRVIVLTTFDADDMVLRALAAGAQGFLLKDTAPERMIDAIRQVAAGEHSLSPTVLEHVIELATGGAAPRRDEARAELAVLNRRERQVALAISRGLTNAEISAEQFLSVATVKTTISGILDKLGMSNRVQVAIRVHDAEWTDV